LAAPVSSLMVASILMPTMSETLILIAMVVCPIYKFMQPEVDGFPPKGDVRGVPSSGKTGQVAK
jgi:hypothetical protein